MTSNPVSANTRLSHGEWGPTSMAIRAPVNLPKWRRTAGSFVATRSLITTTPWSSITATWLHLSLTSIPIGTLLPVRMAGPPDF
jgi:hypothetical protein